MNATLAGGASAVRLPFYHFHRDEIVPGLPDVYLSILAPFLAYWVVSLLFYAIDNSGLDFFERHRIHLPEESKTKNKVTVSQVVWAVFLQQAIQTVLGLVWLTEDDPAFGPFRDHSAAIERYSATLARWGVVVLGETLGQQAVKLHGPSLAAWIYWWGVPIVQFLWAAFVLDAWQYFWHRYFHTNVFLYRHVHSWHHRLYAPYAFGALYNHPLEGFILDTLGVVFFALSTVKTVDDHCGYAFPWDPVQHLFGNNADYHDIHHQIGGLKANFSQPYFIHFDYFLGTRMTRAQYNARKSLRDMRLNTPSSTLSGPNELAPTPTSTRNHAAVKED